MKDYRSKRQIKWKDEPKPVKKYSYKDKEESLMDKMKASVKKAVAVAPKPAVKKEEPKECPCCLAKCTCCSHTSGTAMAVTCACRCMKTMHK